MNENLRILAVTHTPLYFYYLANCTLHNHPTTWYQFDLS
ncbi:hypothetical protein PMAG_a3372 [Pseudoalteromonas mariniglutinosa NCIMB 1770]|nr:hypothetical protein [Pseudoalteromonas mariniglutinosa NCIMB 1770]